MNLVVLGEEVLAQNTSQHWAVSQDKDLLLVNSEHRIRHWLGAQTGLSSLVSVSSVASELSHDTI